MESTTLRRFLELPYDELEELNLTAKAQRLERVDRRQVEEERQRYLTDEKRIKAVTVCFSDLEGRFHMLDYDKKFLLKSADNLTFDGSSVRGFSPQSASDLRLAVDWSAFYWLPADIFGPGKVIAFGEVLDADSNPYQADFRGRLHRYTDDLQRKEHMVCHAAPEIEGFLFQGTEAERRYHETGTFEFISTGGYYHSMPQDPLRQFMDGAAETQRALGFGNEKDHPEVAPSQFEMNFAYSDALVAADQIQLYKLICRQVAQRMGMTASFLPKPIAGMNGNGMHTNISLSRDGKNLFFDPDAPGKLSALSGQFVNRILHHAPEICLVLNPSVNAYRRLDPQYEAPNQIMASAIDRGAMIRLPLGNERSVRIEVRSVAPDANPYLLLFTLLHVGLAGEGTQPAAARDEARYLPGNIHDALALFAQSTFMRELLGAETHAKYMELKQAGADRCPKALGSRVKVSEIMFHHEVCNQLLWGMF